MRSIARVCVTGRGTKSQGAEVGLVVAAVGEVFLKDEGIQLMGGGNRGDDDADILFEASPERRGHGVP